MKIKVVFYIVSFLLTASLQGMAQSAPEAEALDSRNVKYRDVRTIESKQLHQDYTDSIVSIIDVRSPLEYKTIHIKGAVNIPLTGNTFIHLLSNSIRQAPDKKIAFY